MACIAFYRFDQIGNEIMPSLELYIDVCPGILRLNLQPHQAVVDADDKQHAYCQDDQGNPCHRCSVAGVFRSRELVGTISLGRGAVKKSEDSRHQAGAIP